MKHLILILSFLCNTCIAQAQNHVANGSFEQYTKCPIFIDTFAHHFADWYNYTHATPDYYNACSPSGFGVPKNFVGNQYAARGKGYAGIITYDPGSKWREYVAVAIQPLEQGKSYTVGLSVSLADKASWASDGVGVFFKRGKDFVNTIDRLLVIPQVSFDNYGIIKDSVNWTRLEGTFIADQPYDLIVIGSFKESPQKIFLKPDEQPYAYYFVDSVYVIPQGWQFPPEMSVTISDSVFCTADSLLLSYKILNNDSFNKANKFYLDLVAENHVVLPLATYASYKSGTIRTVVSAQIPQGIYRLRLIASSPADTLYLDTIRVYSYPSINAGIDKAYCDEDIYLRTDIQPGIDIYWSGPNKFLSHEADPVIPRAGEQHSGLYIVVAYNNGCNSIDSLEIKINCAEVQVPAAFSPNGDGVNDLLRLYGTDNVKQLSFRIYNRWGQVVYETTDVGATWDGGIEGSATGVQTVAYVLEAVLRNGKTTHKAGKITIIR